MLSKLYENYSKCFIHFRTLCYMKGDVMMILIALKARNMPCTVRKTTVCIWLWLHFYKFQTCQTNIKKSKKLEVKVSGPHKTRRT